MFTNKNSTEKMQKSPLLETGTYRYKAFACLMMASKNDAHSSTCVLPFPPVLCCVGVCDDCEKSYSRCYDFCMPPSSSFLHFFFITHRNSKRCCWRMFNSNIMMMRVCDEEQREQGEQQVVRQPASVHTVWNYVKIFAFSKRSNFIAAAAAANNVFVRTPLHLVSR